MHLSRLKHETTAIGGEATDSPELSHPICENHTGHHGRGLRDLEPWTILARSYCSYACVRRKTREVSKTCTYRLGRRQLLTRQSTARSSGLIIKSSLLSLILQAQGRIQGMGISHWLLLLLFSISIQNCFYSIFQENMPASIVVRRRCNSDPWAYNKKL